MTHVYAVNIYGTASEHKISLQASSSVVHYIGGGGVVVVAFSSRQRSWGEDFWWIQPEFELATFRSRVRLSTHLAIPTPNHRTLYADENHKFHTAIDLAESKQKGLHEHSQSFTS